MYYLILTDPTTCHVFTKKSDSRVYLDKNFNKLGKPGADYKEVIGNVLNELSEKFTLVFH